MIWLSKAAHVIADTEKEDENRSKLPTSRLHMSCKFNVEKAKSKSKPGFRVKGQAGRHQEQARSKKGELFTFKYGFQRNTPPMVL